MLNGALVTYIGFGVAHEFWQHGAAMFGGPFDLAIGISVLLPIFLAAVSLAAVIIRSRELRSACKQRAEESDPSAVGLDPAKPTG